jgi:hypothetical protein
VLSGSARILMPVWISKDAVRLSALVAAGVASGYLWRAAFEPGEPTVLRPLAPAVDVVGEAFDRTPVRTTVRPAHSGRAARAAPRVNASRSHPVGRVRTPVTRMPAPAAQPEPSKPSPRPSPQPAASPPVTTPSGSDPPPASSPASPVAAPPEKSVVAAAPAQAPATTTPTASAEEPETDRERPGWGHGDENHDHTGPAGGKGH